MSDDSTVMASSPMALAAAEREAGAKPAALVVIAGELTGKVFDLDQDEVSLGRSDESDIVLECNGVSRRHLLLTAMGGDFVARDVGSKNGTFVNDCRVTDAVVLKKGDVIRLGPVALKYVPRGDPERLAYDRLNDRTQLDRFTGCYNKTYFNERIDIEVGKCKAKAAPLSLLVFDIDHFKAINDEHGHDAGDHVLRELAALIQAHGVRKHDTCARYGGEEFVILLPDTELAAALEIAERVRRLVAEKAFDYHGRPMSITVSVGVADCNDDTATGEELFRCADAALYEAKRAGRNRVRTGRG